MDRTKYLGPDLSLPWLLGAIFRVYIGKNRYWIPALLSKLIQQQIYYWISV
jgi:hypothetical protein